MGEMAAVDRPGASEARIPCPVCGALIHPIAGRCKHCKEDLRGVRTARPAAVIALPRLAATPAAPPAPYARLAEPAPYVESGAITVPRPHGPGHEARAILPPRVPVADSEGGRSVLRNWPIVVIVLAVVAIIGAVAVMIWPQGKASGGGTTGAHTLEPPAPLDRMDTNPLPSPSAPPPPSRPAPPPAKADPWSPDRHTRIAPPDPLTLPPDRLDTLADPRLDLITAAFQHYCRARAACPDGRDGPDGDDVVLATVCTPFAARAVAPPSCASAGRCLAHFDRISCAETLDADRIEDMFTTFDDCLEAARC